MMVSIFFSEPGQAYNAELTRGEAVALNAGLDCADES